jgi:sugar/nucleoside kinase (ribokinase family)
VGQRVRQLGVIGTMVWDRIYRRTPLPAEPVEEWGGIAYALAGLDAALPDDWEIVPLVRVGRDLAPEAERFLRDLRRCATTARFIEVPHPNNRVTLHYESDVRRSERMAGGVPPWTWAELGPLVRDLDALYVNFISGFELTLETAQQLRDGFPGPIYADLHSLLLGITRTGHRFPQALPHVTAWFACFDVVQANEEELALVGDDPLGVAAQALAAGVGLLLVTVGARGAVYFTQGPFTFDRRRPPAAGTVETARIPASDVVTDGDPTGCGDVFGATLLAGLLGGHPVPDAVRRANAAAGRNLRHRGATRLHHHLRGAIALQ